MNISINNRLFQSAVACAMVACLSLPAVADDSNDSNRERLVKEKRLSTIAKTQTPVEGFESVEMFSAMESGEIEVIFKAKSSADSNLLVTNNTDRPLAIQMPATFAAVPVLRQFGGGMGGMGGMGGQGMGGMGGQGMGGMGGMMQGMGGGMGMGMGGGGMGMGGGMGGQGMGGMGGGGGVFNIPPGKSGRLSVKTFCLEHGKPDPTIRADYAIIPLEKFNSDPKIAEMCRMLASDEITQPVAQAAAWHVTDGLSWQEMMVKNRIERMDGYTERYFHPNHIALAAKVVVMAEERAVARQNLEEESKKSVESVESVGETVSIADPK